MSRDFIKNPLKLCLASTIILQTLFSVSCSNHKFILKDVLGYNSCYDKNKTESIDSKIDEYFQALGLQTNLPIEKFLKNIDPEKLERDEQDYPGGQRDIRGERLYAVMTTHKKESEFNIVFTGNWHIPYFHKRLREEGFKPFIISSYHSIEPEQSSSLDLLRVLRTYPIYESTIGKPILLIGDRHGAEYNTTFPEPERLKDMGIEKIYFHMENVPYKGTKEEKIACIKKRKSLWGAINLYNYAGLVAASGIEISINGLES